MDKTNGKYTPGGRPELQENPLFSEIDPTDSGEGQTLQSTKHQNQMENEMETPFKRNHKVIRSPVLSKSSSALDISQGNVQYFNDRIISKLKLENEELKKKLSQIDQVISKMKGEITVLKKENLEHRKVKTNEANTPMTSGQCQTNSSNWLIRQFPPIQTENIFNVLDQEEYCTDEDELEKEVNNTDNQNNKKRRRTATNTPPKVNIQRENKTTEPKIAKIPIPLPPPINVSNIRNFEMFRQKLINTVKESINFRALSNSDVKITVQNENDYRKVKKLLEEIKNESNNQLEGIEYHTYQLKSEKWYRVVIRGLPSSISSEEIKADLEKLGHEVEATTNIFKMVTTNGIKVRKDFPLFYIDLKQKENNKDVFNIKNLAYCSVKIEPPKKTKDIPQCTNCQQLGHTKSFCHRQSKCVKCAENHHTKQCKKEQSTAPTCALCQQKGHTANYKGCPVYQNKIKSQQNYKPNIIQRLQTKSARPPITAITDDGLSYAQVAKISVEEPNDKHKEDKKNRDGNNEPNINNMINILSQIQQTLCQLTERVGKLESISKPRSQKVSKNQK